MRDPIKHPFLYTDSGHLDLSWLILATCMVAGLIAFFCESLGILHITKEAWTWFTAFTGFCFIAGAARDRASILANATSPSGVATAISNIVDQVREHGASTADIPFKSD